MLYSLFGVTLGRIGGRCSGGAAWRDAGNSERVGQDGHGGVGQGLVVLDWELFSTGNTQRVLQAATVQARGIEELTGFPEMLDGRVKTLHPAVHGGILARRDLPEHLATLR